MKNTTPVKRGLISGVEFAVAILGGGVVCELWNVPPLVPALSASIILATLEWLLRQNSPHTDIELRWGVAVEWSVAFTIAAIVLIALVTIKKSMGAFVCEPLVPWGISIAIYGAFFSAWITKAMIQSGNGARLQPALRLMLLWIAPFYGFFHAPWFLAQSLAMSCPDRPFEQVVMAALAMAISAYGGNRLASWMYNGPA